MMRTLDRAAGVLLLLGAAGHTLAWICLGGSLAWAGVVVGFGLIIGQLIDPRVDMHLVASLALAGFSVRTLLGRASQDGAVPVGQPASP